jgi:hypothetical protein
MCAIVQTTGRMVTSVLTAIAVVAALTACSARGGLFGGTPPSSSLASALDQIPDMPDAHIMFTDWSMLGHHASKEQDAAPFAGQLLWVDDALQRDLGIRSTNADWEIDVWQPHRYPTVVLHYDGHTDLAGLAAKLTRLGYHANGSIFTGSADQRRTWTLSLRNIGIATDRQLLIGGPDATAVRSVLADSALKLGHHDSVTPLLALAAARLGRIATASLVVGSGACVSLTELIGLSATPAMLATLRKQFPGKFTRPQAELTAEADPAGTTALDALTFPDQGTAQANKAARTAAGKKVSGIDGDADVIRVTSSTVTGRVLSFTMTAGHPHAFAHHVLYNSLGVDICK